MTEISNGIKKEDYDAAVELIYSTDPYLYRDLFGDLDCAKKVLPMLMDDPRSVFYEGNYHVAKIGDEVVGIAALYKNTSSWNEMVVRNAFYEAGCKCPESYDSVSEYFRKVFNYASTSINACNITVSEKHRKKGIGTDLLEHLIVVSGNGRIELNVLADNTAAISLYKRHGFKIDRSFDDYGGHNSPKVKSLQMSREGKSEERLREKPPMYQDRRNPRDDDKYVFISYSHRNEDIVYEDLKALYERDLRYWYDVALAAGKEWDTEVAKIIEDKNCLGILFFMTEDLFLSKAVHEEIKMYHRIKKDRDDFFFICISPDSRSVGQVVQGVYQRLSDMDSASLELSFPLKRLECIVRTFKDTTIFIGRPKDSLNHIDQIVQHLKKNGSLFANDESILSTLLSKRILSNIDERYYFVFGKYPQTADKDVPPVAYNGKFSWDGKDYFAVNGDVFSYDNISWRLIELDGVRATFVADTCLDFKNGGPELIQWLEGDFINGSFDEKERECIDAVSLMSVDCLSKNADSVGNIGRESDYFKKICGNIYTIWLSDISGESKRASATRNGDILNEGKSFWQNGAVRPVIHVSLGQFL